ncbi:MAG TPA: cytochrome c oxidase subunit 3 [Chthonomonadaceae bacterium]|nr:cytochrome c oxidase subunit 3 [Chthonomonadaceae bacterium]
MSSEAAEVPRFRPREADEDLGVQYEDMEQQNESYIVGMWTFLVTEIMFFGALFLAYLTYRTLYPSVFMAAHYELDVKLGAINTVVLLTSSFSMAIAVWAAQTKNRAIEIGGLIFTMICACAFLVIKGFEWAAKFEHRLVPGPLYAWPPHGYAGPVVPGNETQMFFCLYFAMTGLHALHVIIGLLVMIVLLVLILKDSPLVRYYMPVEMTGLYWHFVDVVWIFLFPLYYLIPSH